MTDPQANFLPASSSWMLQCVVCATEFPLGPHLFGCPLCQRRGSPHLLEVRFRPDQPPLAPAERRGKGLLRYRDLLPGGQTPDWISLGEGDTPLVLSRHIGPALGLPNLYFKN